MQPDADWHHFGGHQSVAIRSGQSIGSPRNDTLKTFRLSWTYQVPEDRIDPREIAFQLLFESYLRNPNSAQLLTSLARQNLLGERTNMADAADFALAAVSDRPNDPATLFTFVHLAMLARPAPDSSLYQRAMGFAKRYDKVTGGKLSDEFAVLYLRIADEYFNGGKIDKAADAYIQSYQLAPDQFNVFDRLGICLISRREKEAEHYFKLGIERSPNSWTHAHYGSLLARTKRFDEAKQQLERALELEPNNATVIARLAELAAFQKRFEESDELWQRHRKVAKFQGSAVYQSALVAAEVGRDGDALQNLEEMYRQTGGGLRDILLLKLRTSGEKSVKDRLKQALSEKGNTMPGLLGSVVQLITKHDRLAAFEFSYESDFRLHNPDRVVQLMDILREFTPDWDDCHQVHAMAHIDAGDWDDAAAAARRALDLDDGQDGIGQFVIAGWHNQNGDKEEAEQEYSTAMRLWNASPSAVTIAMGNWLRTRPELKSLRDKIAPKQTRL